MAICRKCGVELVKNENWWPSNAELGNCICIECATAYSRQYRKEHKEEIAAQRCKYGAEHKKEIAARRRKYEAEHKKETAARHREYRAEHKEERAAYDRQYCREHREEKAKYDRQYCQERSEEIAARKHRYYKAHQEERAAYKRQYRKEHSEKEAARERKRERRWYHENLEEARARVREKVNRRRARTVGATIELVDDLKIYELYNHTCVYCGSKEDLTLDHIVSLAAGGAHAEDNLVVACRSCNSSKYIKPLEEWLQTQPRARAWVM